MSILLLLLLTGLVVVIGGVWLTLALLGTLGRAVGWTLNTLFGSTNPPPRDVARCANDKCNAPWRAGARFCGRCGCAAAGVAPRLRIAARVA